MTKTKHPHLTLLLIFCIFFLPLVLAWIVYKEKIPEKTTQHGELILPPADLYKMDLQMADKEVFDQGQLYGRWLMLYVNPSQGCNASCKNMLYAMRQIRLASGKNQQRLQRAILTFQNTPEVDKLIQTDYPGTFHLLIGTEQFQQAMQQIPSTKLALTQGYLYLVDPLGNVMMGYNVNTNLSDIFKDIQKLLRVSQIG